jgi:hypothetical protein
LNGRDNGGRIGSPVTWDGNIIGSRLIALKAYPPAVHVGRELLEALDDYSPLLFNPFELQCGPHISFLRLYVKGQSSKSLRNHDSIRSAPTSPPLSYCAVGEIIKIYTDLEGEYVRFGDTILSAFYLHLRLGGCYFRN